MPGRFELADLRPNQIADQWTLLDFRNFSKIKRDDFISKKLSEDWESMVKRSSIVCH